MIPIVFGLGGLIARVAAVAVIPRLAKALSAAFSPPSVAPPLESGTEPEATLGGEKQHFSASLHPRSYPINFTDPSGLIENPSQGWWEGAVATAFSFETMGQVALSTLDAYLTAEGLRSAFGVGFNLAQLSGPVRNYQRKALLRGAEAADRGGYSIIGRALSKHTNRIGDILEGQFNKGNAEALNKAGSQMIKEVLECPWTTYEIRETKKYGKVVEAWAANGMGLRWTEAGRFLGILNPK